MTKTRSAPRIQTLVDKLSRRDRLSDDEIVALKKALEPPRSVAVGADIVREHTRPSASTLLISGFSARYSSLEDGSRQITEINVSGDFIDLHSLLMKQMDHGVVTLTECVVADAPHTRLIDITERHPHLARLLWLDTIIDAAIHRQWLVAMGRRSGLGHLAHLVCELYLRLQAVGQTGGLGFELPLTQSVLGDALGLSTVHVSRLISELRAEGVVQWSGGRVEILDWRRLAEIAEFDPTYLRLQSEPV
ncbi:Crp/Fnr family transcriptional regulator [Brevundimonas sp. SORGH_AS_0993]|uniref:Crp/Fnr family transcriptional regulator n=1 Tax=Brevundimonas sp. SORGH_AS_0993 TaxID=3041794 RepID=UPI002780CFE9|nr:Crp/Fnr family transcriptional regulator [Brevundimonas sp. SORGH_AS_0993]MDQ1154795.1 CRP-like cAMP-binding protein [Brevundimonas sp. SORGH_AS_0993]